MDPTDEDRQEAKPHLHKAFEDPHYHDDELDSPDDPGAKRARGSASKKPARRIPPPPRRWPVDD